MRRGQPRYASWKSEGFPLWLRERLEERGITITELGRRMNTPGTVITRWMQGKNLPDNDSQRKIADVLRISYDEVYNATGLRPVVETDEDPRRLELVRRIQELELTPERVVVIRAMLGAFEAVDDTRESAAVDGKSVLSTVRW